MKILFIGDVVGSMGRKTLEKVLPGLILSDSIDFVVANAENSAQGRGTTPAVLAEMQSIGVDYFTGGDHIYWQKGFEEAIEEAPLVRPANYPDPAPGKTIGFLDKPGKGKLVILNLMGRTFLNDNLDNPFTRADILLEELNNHSLYKDCSILVDFHAEATSEKVAMGRYLDGRVTAVVGTHTHVPTSDTQVLPKGTCYVSDVGMTGSFDSVLGVRSDIILKLFLSGRQQKFEWEDTGRAVLSSVLINTLDNSIIRKDRLLDRL